MTAQRLGGLDDMLILSSLSSDGAAVGCSFEEESISSDDLNVSYSKSGTWKNVGVQLRNEVRRSDYGEGRVTI